MLVGGRKAGDDRGGLAVRRRNGVDVGEPPRVQAVVQAAEREELSVRAFLDDATVVEHEDAVRALHRR